MYKEIYITMRKMKIGNKMLTNLNGLLAVLFGLVALLFPGIAIVALAIYFAITILIGGIVLTFNSASQRNKNPAWTLLLFEGIVGILIGIIILSRPELSAAVFVTIIGLWAIFIGLIFLMSYFRSRKYAHSNYFALVIGALSFIIGLLIAVDPFKSSRAIVVLIGIYAIFYGLFSFFNTSRLYH
jgi:uncharacterized membrane protein HdeD (DUF308 family)